MTDSVEVTQADREAAWPFAPDCYKNDPNGTEPQRLKWMAGVYDHTRILQSFARHRLASQGEVADLVAELKDIREIFAEAAKSKLCDPYILPALRALCDDAGYGNVMSSVSALWRDKLGPQEGGAFVAGPCLGTIKNAITRINTILSKHNGAGQQSDGAVMHHQV